MTPGGSTRQALWPVLPLLAFLAVVFMGPIARVLLWGLAPATGPTAPTGAPWRELLATPLYRDALLRTFRLSLTVTLVCLALGYPVAYALARARGLARAAPARPGRGALLDQRARAELHLDGPAAAPGGRQPPPAGARRRAGAGAPRLQRAGRPHRDDPRPAAVHDPVAVRRHARDRPRPPSGSGRAGGDRVAGVPSGLVAPVPAPASAPAASSSSWWRSDSSSRPPSSGAGR